MRLFKPIQGLSQLVFIATLVIYTGAPLQAQAKQAGEQALIRLSRAKSTSSAQVTRTIKLTVIAALSRYNKATQAGQQQGASNIDKLNTSKHQSSRNGAWEISNPDRIVFNANGQKPAYEAARLARAKALPENTQALETLKRL